MTRAAPRAPVALPPRPAARPLALDDPIQFLPGVGPRRAELFAALGVRAVRDLLEFFPFRHERHEHLLIIHLEPGQIATIVGRITAVRGGGRSRGPALRATILDNTARCSVVWFNAPYVSRRISVGSIVRLTGKVGEFGGLPQMVNPRVEILDDSAAPVDESRPPALEPVYHCTAGLTSQAIARVIRANLDRAAGLLTDWLPDDFRAARSLWPRPRAVLRMHLPAADVDVPQARRRLAYDELLLMQLAVTIARHQRRRDRTARALRLTREIDARIRRRLPFPLTPAQNAAVRDITADLARPVPMHRLLQGDVGSGKTLVAIYAALVAIANRAQVAVMAPTELLAEQLYRNADRYLAGSRVQRTLLTGGLSASRRKSVLADLAAGRLDLVVGTHALLEPDVRFDRLGLVVVDEQHRFGVRQRALVREKGPSPHFLMMTATPIPRTLAMTVFGDLDVTTIDRLPPGRAPVRSRVVLPHETDAAWAFVRSRIAAGEQVFVVYPLVEETETSRLRAATAESRRLAADVFRGTPVGLVHGRMKPDEKQRVMADFAAGRTPVLVATTVVEVGIDVPAATVMVIQHADRYGLSQLHQLRGRIGRGGRPGYCLLMADSAAAAENARLAVLTQTTDGFRIAEEDLRLRGPGEVLGTRQHGLPELRVADLVNDLELLCGAQRDAAALLRADPALEQPRHRPLRDEVVRRYGACFDLAATG